ncbi:HutD family protein [Niveispirillum sp. SYP-B3756]|uniref:HutD/Ves family protein n=1 Tax=Niveispirillum sp. SYP-B3756 TaxID=2662178 RepID=UPI00129298A7|nr:HutD family protein [Niveispirillum sp. SYP-B3756]MQP67284.1 HutD family protein [Niveispirillum sp. SYP-B3756]
MQWLKAADYRRTPWKNGGGVTAEIAVFPAAAGLDDFGWRLSMAAVAADGPFSTFPSIDRTLTVLSGRLALNGHPLGPKDPPFAFDGDMAVDASLMDGPVTDLNVMTRQGHFCHHVERRTLRAGETMAAKGGPLFAIALVAGVAGLGQWDTLALSQDDVVIVCAGGPALLVRIWAT